MHQPTIKPVRKLTILPVSYIPRVESPTSKPINSRKGSMPHRILPEGKIFLDFLSTRLIVKDEIKIAIYMPVQRAHTGMAKPLQAKDLAGF
jgi:hypothetical protein